jgi:signal peptidase II
LKIYFPTILVVLIDQASKLWIINNLPHWESWNIIGSFVRFTHVKNPGIAFGISVGNFTMIVAILSIVATLFIAYMHWQERKNHPLIVIGLGLILGGAIGNLIDRSSIFFSKHYEGVVDFIDIGTANFRWYTFNVADSAVTIGIIFYLIHSLFTNKPELLEVND